MNKSNRNSTSKLSESFPSIKISLGARKNYGLLYGLLFLIFWITTNLIAFFLLPSGFDLIENTVTLIVINLFLTGLGILCWKLGFLRRKEIIVFTIHPYKNQLIYERFWSHIRTIEKKYLLEDIVGFDVHKRPGGFGKLNSDTYKELILKFKLNKPKCLTKTLKEENIVEKARELNQFLVSNTKLEEKDVPNEIVPEIHEKSKKKLKFLITLILIFGSILTFLGLIIWISVLI